jgi:hypothetical protein
MDLANMTGLVGGALGVVATAIAVGGAVGKPLRRLSRQNDEFREDWYGQAARPGRSAEPGVMERLGNIEKELHPNGGGSLRDAVNLLGLRLEDHIRSHQQPPPPPA